ncbi:hypothetical protein Btru_069322 [Bulinus truncatus]|nr:hypothetical protein Btru_069322 [Bulinus truncatus]
MFVVGIVPQTDSFIAALYKEMYANCRFICKMWVSLCLLATISSLYLIPAVDGRNVRVIVRKPIRPAVIVRRPIRPVIVRKPIRPVIVRRPIRPVIVRKPIRPVIVRKPIRPVIIREPSNPVIIREPNNPIIIREPSNPVIIRKPNNPIIIREPTNPVIIREPSNPVIIREPSNTIIIREPSNPVIIRETDTPAQTTIKPTTTKTTTTVKPCDETAKADIMLILDASSSIGSENWNHQTQFAAEITDAFSIGNVRFGMIVFNEKPSLIFDMNTYLDKQSLYDAIINVQYPKGQGTYTSRAFEMIQDDQLFSHSHGGRLDANDVVIIMTDGLSSDREETQRTADSLKADGITVIAVGIGSLADKIELEGMATDPKKHVFRIDSFDMLHVLKAELVKSACDEVSVG